MFTSRTLFSLEVECWEDVFEADPLERHRNPDGHIQLKNTGDAMIDKWEEQIANDEAVNLWEVFPPEEIKKIQKMRQKAEANPAISGMSLKGAVEQAEAQVRKMSKASPHIPERPGWTRGFGGDGT